MSGVLHLFRCGSSGGAGGNGGGGGGGGNGGGSGGVGGPCGACKFLRRKCVPECIFAPYFNSDQGATQFASVHKVFGASNVTKLLNHIPMDFRMDAVVSVCYEAQARLRDPVYGCVSQILSLQQQVANLQAEITYLQAHFTAMQIPIPPPMPPQSVTVPPLTMSDLPSGSSVPPPVDISSLMGPNHPMGPRQPNPWHMQAQSQAHNPMGPPNISYNQVGPVAVPIAGDQLQAILAAREFLQRHGPEAFGHVPNNGQSSVGKSD